METSSRREAQEKPGSNIGLEWSPEKTNGCKKNKRPL
jgi:hypothetical protein